MSKEHDDLYKEFNDLVNMSPSELESWLETDHSKDVGEDSGDGESKGRKSAKKILDIKGTKKADLTDAQYEHMGKVVSYIKRHSAQKPDGKTEDTDWAYSLKNWGHDPAKK